MKQIVPSTSRYIPLVQQKSCCVPACISMIMYKHRIPLIPQELLGYHLGLIVPPEVRSLFWSPRTGNRPPSGWGTRIALPQYNPNKIFIKLGIPLKMEFKPISHFSDRETFERFLDFVVRDDRDILACFDHGELSGDHVRAGHVCLIDRVNLKNKTVRLIDPLQSQPKWRNVPISQLKKAMEFHGDDKSGGFWEFTKIIEQ